MAELVEALRQHVELLRYYWTKAFKDGNEACLGEVAGKLRVLVGERGGNRALLLGLMKALDVKIEFVLNRPPIEPFRPGDPRGGDTVTLRRFLSSFALGMRLPSGEWVELTQDDVIHSWAEQYGAAHEDWALDERFAALRDLGIFIKGEHHLAQKLRSIAGHVLWVADKFLAQVTPEKIAEAERKRGGAQGSPR